MTAISKAHQMRCYHPFFAHTDDDMPRLEIEISTEFIPLNDLLKICGVVDSGGAGKALVASGVVKVDGQQELRKTNKIRPGQLVEVGEYAITVKAAAD